MASDDITLYVVAYDMSIDKRRTKVHNVLSAYGKWTQFSLFECWLSRKQFVALRGKLAPLVDATKDSVRFYPLCGECQGKVITIGGERPSDDVAFFI